MTRENDVQFMNRALELAARGQGHVEPNPMVGCVAVKDDVCIAEGWHQRFGGSHAEIEALQQAGDSVAGGTLYVTLEPCCHQGKTPPCSEAIVKAGIRRVVVAMRDPFPQVDGGGIARLQSAGIEVQVGVREEAARELNAPYLKLIQTGRPWVISKWAMTLDGKLATRTGDSKWISNEKSRAIVHQIRGRADAILVGHGTAKQDDPLLTARPAGPRTATRIVMDSESAIRDDSQLVRTAKQIPVLIATSDKAPLEHRQRLEQAGCEVLLLTGTSNTAGVEQLLDELGRRRMTNVLVEGGGTLLGSFFDARAVDEVHVFIAPKIVGGQATAIQGQGIATIAQALQLDSARGIDLDGDLYLNGKVRHQ